ncbi:MAG: hypothetical protein H0X34_09195 [Chthoniobacterales bacterium]|nr:hypothetical protein [Chthoniobacterales bacterium]
MSDGQNRDVGYWFALPRLVARIAGRKVRRAEWSRWEAYGVGLLVFGIGCVFLAHALFEVVRPWALRSLCLLITPVAIWIACLLVYFVNWLIAGLLRRLGLYSAPTNNPLQSVMIISLITLLALLLLRDESGWFRSLGAFWLALLALNLLSAAILRTRHVP